MTLYSLNFTKLSNGLHKWDTVIWSALLFLALDILLFYFHSCQIFYCYQISYCYKEPTVELQILIFQREGEPE